MLVERMLSRRDETAPEPRLEVGTPVEHLAIARMKTGWRGAVQPIRGAW
jgi:hypothetical protein